ncbi:MAG: hypothetical protein AAFU41_18205 [Pseudomonadota bacterium]
MKKTLSVVAILGLSACMGGGGDGGVSLVSNSVDATMNDDFEVLLNGVRTSNATWDTDIARAVQDHADDMVNEGYLSVNIPGTTNPNNSSGMRDIGDRMVEEGYTWNELGQYVTEGDKTLTEVFNEFNALPCGNAGQDLCLDDVIYENFGIGKADNGGEPKWAFAIASPG